MLFKNTIRVVDFAKLASTVNFNNIAPTIRMVEEQHIIPVLGQQLYDVLNAAYAGATAETDLTAPQQNLLDKCRNVIGPLVCYYYTPKAEVILSDAGAQRLETGNNKTAFQNQIINFREQNLRESEMATELLLQFLEENKTDYASWVTSDGFKDYRSLFIKTGKEFQSLFPSASPYRNYFAMRPRMKDIEENTIRTLLGDDLFASLKETDADADGAFTDVETDLIFKIKKAVAYLTVAATVPFLNVRIDGNGLTIKALARAQDDMLSARGQASSNDMGNLIAACKEAGASWIDAIKKWMDINTSPPAGRLPLDSSTCNRERTGSFGMF